VALPDALQALHTDEPGSSSRAAVALREEWSEIMPVMASAADTVQEVLQQQEGVFGALVQQLSQHKETKLLHAQPDSMSVDVCFCIDVTGSMSGWIEACKAQVQAIAQGLMPKLENKCPDVEVLVRWALVAYRDVGDAQRLLELPFTEDSSKLVKEVSRIVVSVCPVEDKTA
jgi:hypothetical protein